MNDKKMISIDQFNLSERVAVEEAFKGLMEKYRQRTGKDAGCKERERVHGGSPAADYDDETGQRESAG
ncbi:hypothetical protein Q3H59_002053 [Pantoea sp. SORGH_AS 659]|nr:hypothetical protein [Pantoea sp. SORGH_AS_0659]